MARGRSVRLEPYGPDFLSRLLGVAAEPGTRVGVSGLCEGVVVRREAAEPPAETPPHHWSPRTFLGLPSPDVETGDADFDRDFYLAGPPALMLALSSDEARRALKGLRWGPVRVGEIQLLRGELSVDVPDTAMRRNGRRHLAAVEQAARLALEIASLLGTPPDIPQRLSDNISGGSLRSVRLRNLTTLAQDYPDHALTRAALRRALADPDPEMRLCAGIELRAEGVPTLEALAADRRVPDATSALAVEALDTSLATPRLSELLNGALGPRPGSAQRPLTASACIDVLGGRGEPAVPALKRAQFAEGPAGIAAVRALERIGGPAVESALLAALPGEEEERAVAIARALGTVGSVAAVAQLKEAAQRGGRLKGAARQAIAGIQARAGGTPGQLSLAEGNEGRLSLADEHAGQVSLAETKRGGPGSWAKGSDPADWS